MNLGAFAVIAALQRRPGVTSSLSTFAGLGRREPLLAAPDDAVPAVAHGIPPTAGFFAKAYVILAAVEAGGPAMVGLAVLAVLNAAVAAFYYLRVVVYMFMRDVARGSGARRGMHGWAARPTAGFVTSLDHGAISPGAPPSCSGRRTPRRRVESGAGHVRAR